MKKVLIYSGIASSEQTLLLLGFAEIKPTTVFLHFAIIS